MLRKGILWTDPKCAEWKTSGMIRQGTVVSFVSEIYKHSFEMWRQPMFAQRRNLPA